MGTVKWVMLLLAAVPVLAGCGRVTEESNNEADPVLITAAESGDLDTVLMLLDSESSSVDTRDSCHWTPLMKAALNGHTGVVKTLLDAGAHVDLVDKGGYTALMLAASNDHNETVSLLLDQGADPNHVEMTNGWTALIWAAKRGHMGSVDLLLNRGALPSTRGFDGRSAADWAREGGFASILNRLDPG